MRTILARAKVNLFLKVLAKRPDGFHEIESIFHSIDLADEVTLAPADITTVEMVFGDGVLPFEVHREDNIAYRAADRLLADGNGVAVRIRKVIPHGGGLAGGSADAAAVLTGLVDMGYAHLSDEELIEIAAELGSDVPYCLTGGPALVTGRGEKVTPLPTAGSSWLVLGISSEPLATAAVYSTWEPGAEGPSSHAMTLALGSGDAAEIAAALHNDLEVPAFRLRPELADAKQVMLDAGALGAVMSGSGPTIIGMASDREHAGHLAGLLERAFDRVEVTSTEDRSLEVQAPQG